MKRLPLLLAAGVLAMSASAAQAGVVFSDPFTSTPVVAPGSNYTQNVSGEVTNVNGGPALHFTQFGSGGDLNSILFAGPGTYTISVDYFCGNSNGCGGYLGLIPGSTSTVPSTPPNGGDAWLATDTQAAYGTPFTLVSGAEGFQTNTFTFTVTSPGMFGLKLEDFIGSGGVAGDAYFRNLSVSDVPEPASWAMMLFGFGMIGFAARRRRRTSNGVAFA